MAFEPFCENYYSASFPFAVQKFTKFCILTHSSAEPFDVPKRKKKGCENTLGSKYRAFSLVGIRNLLNWGLFL